MIDADDLEMQKWAQEQHTSEQCFIEGCTSVSKKWNLGRHYTAHLTKTNDLRIKRVSWDEISKELRQRHPEVYKELDVSHGEQGR